MRSPVSPRSLAVVFALLGLSAGSARAEDKLVPSVRKPKVDIVFAIDTTGSMGGLIDGAKRKIWSIANEVQRAQQKPEVRIGLVAFRDRGDEYVTRTSPLTRDLDRVYETLMALRADGGGDTPEDVNAGLDAAVNAMQWNDEKDTLKLVFLVGDAPPHMDYQDQKRWQKIAQQAVRKNIYINTVLCGGDGETAGVWRNIAHAAEGRFAAIAQDGGVALAAATPYDDELKRLAADLDSTYLDYGTKGAREENKAVRARAGALASTAAPAAVAADRAVAKASAAPMAENDLVDFATQSGGAAAALAKVKPEALPEELRGKSTKEQAAALEALSKKRDSITKKIAEVSKQRQAHLDAEKAKAPAKADGFDSEVVDAIRTQGKGIGLTY